ncbi:MAG TPA: LysE family translocator [Frateuria sp.]|uniref:LysE family translocator n=1 Tax=Frateuria sp. TaxID=2211372 RepID=UPI002D8015BD|nr:LysE family translocator [Frateuria sp.]HET6805954.1 LysE family translocator [Frateuria sp.]
MHHPTLLAFALLQGLFAITPGPAVLLTASHAMARGTVAGLRVALGIQLANVCYLALSALGVGLLLRAWPPAFHGLKLVGAVYLAWRGSAAVRAAWTAGGSEPGGNAATTGRPFTEGLVGQLANPKSIIFFGALLPLFVAPGHALLPQYALLAALCMAIELPVLGAYAAMAAAAGRLAHSARAVRLRQACSGACLVVVAVLLALVPLADR